MKDNFVGEIIKNLRMEAGISQAVLSKGLMHNRELSRIENGTKIPNKLLLDAIFQRLGKSADRIETILSYKEYQLIFLREKIEFSLLKNDMNEYHRYYEEYRKVDDSVLTSQYLSMLKGISLFVEEENTENCETELLIKGIEVLKGAIYMTFPEWEKGKFSMTYLSIQELQILCLIGYYEWKIGEKEKGKKILEELVKYVTIRFEDLQEKSKIYPHVLYYLAKINYTEGSIQIAKQNCNEAIRNLLRYGDIMFVKENLLLLRMCYKFEGLVDRFDNIKQYIDVIDEILDEVSVEYKIHDSTAILLTSLQSDIVLSGELIRSCRKKKGLSQEEFSWGICSNESLSRIERGRKEVYRSNFYDMLEKLDVKKDYFGGYIVSGDYFSHICVSDFLIHLQHDEFNKAEKCLEMIIEHVDVDNISNKQFIESAEIVLKRKRNEIKAEESIALFNDVLKYTIPDGISAMSQIPSREEVFVINQIAICNKILGRYDGAAEIYGETIKRYDESNVDEKFHGTSLITLLTGYSGALEEINQVDEALMISNRAIKLSIECRRSEILSVLFANRCCIYEKNHNINLAKKSMKIAILLAEAFDNKAERIAYKEYYKLILSNECI